LVTGKILKADACIKLIDQRCVRVCDTAFTVLSVDFRISNCHRVLQEGIESGADVLVGITANSPQNQKVEDQAGKEHEAYRRAKYDQLQRWPDRPHCAAFPKTADDV
jgi:hypothetical protein